MSKLSSRTQRRLIYYSIFEIQRHNVLLGYHAMYLLAYSKMAGKLGADTRRMHHTFLYCSIDIYPISSTK